MWLINDIHFVLSSIPIVFYKIKKREPFFHVKTEELSVDYENEGIIKFKPKRSNKFILQDLNFGYLPTAD